MIHTEKHLSSLASNLKHYLSSGSFNNLQCKQYIILDLVAKAFNFDDYKTFRAEFSPENPLIITPSVIVKLPQLISKEFEIDFNIPALLWPWPSSKDFKITPSEFKVIWENYIEFVVKDKIPALCNFLKYNMPLLSSMGKCQWLVDQRSPLTIVFLKKLIGEQYISDKKGGTNTSFLLQKLDQTNSDIEAKFLLALLSLIDHNYQTAYERFNTCAEKNHREAINQLAYMYRQGLYVQKDLTRAKDLYLRAASLGDNHSLHALGNGHDLDGIFEYHPTLAREYHQKAIALGNDDSIGCLAKMYLHGRGGAVEINKAKELIVKGLQFNNLDCIELAFEFEFEEHGYTNYYFELCHLAEKFQSNLAIEHLANAYLRGSTIKPRNTILGFDFLDRSKITNENRIILACAISAGIKCEQDIALGSEILEKILPKEPEAAFMLGILYSNGELIEPDYDKAINYFHQGAELNHSKCQHQLGYYLYEFYSDNSEKLLESYFWLNKAAHQGIELSQEVKNAVLDELANFGIVINKNLITHYDYSADSLTVLGILKN